MDDRTSGWVNGLIGVTIFAGSLPATRLAVMAIDPLFVTSARAATAAAIAGAALLILRQTRPQGHDWLSLAVVALGVVIGFPVLTGLALRHMESAHANIFIGLLPLSTAIFGVIRGGERPSRLFWLYAFGGAGIVATYALASAAGGLSLGDLMMLAAILVCGLGYAEGARLSRRLGGWQVISWALVLSLPISVTASLMTLPANLATAPASSLAGLAYVSLFSMLIGFVFWYRGLALGGIAAVGQLQLLQPFMALALSALLLKEVVTPAMFAVVAGVVVCVWGARRAA